MRDPLVLVRAIHLLATMLVTGTVFFDVLVAEPALAGQGAALLRSRARSRGLLAGSLALALVSGAAWFALLAARLGEASSVGETAWTLLTETQFGTVWALRAALALLIATSLVSPARAGAAPRWRAIIVAAASATFAATLAWSGHGAATPGAAGDLHVVADALHALAAAIWLGGLVPLALLLASESRRADFGPPVLVDIVRRFSIIGVAAVATLLASGIVNTLFMIDRFDLLWSDDYGRALLLKIVFFGAMLMLAAYNRLTLTPELAVPADNPAQPDRAARRLCANAVVEIALGVAILLIVAWLGITMPGASAQHMH